MDFVGLPHPKINTPIMKYIIITILLSPCIHKQPTNYIPINLGKIDSIKQKLVHTNFNDSTLNNSLSNVKFTFRCI